MQKSYKSYNEDKNLKKKHLEYDGTISGYIYRLLNGNMKY